MTQYNKSTLTTFFSQGDVPQGTDYANLISSFVNQVETSDQPIAGPISPTALNAAQVSAGNVNVTGTLTVAGTFNFNGPFSAATINANTLNITANISAATINVTGDVSAATGTIYASAMRSAFNFHGTPLIVSAAGTAQAMGAVLTAEICRLQGASDGQTTGFIIQANKTGWVQYLANECAVSANLWPPTGGVINGLGANTVFPMAANTPYIIIHRAASAYSVK